MPKGLVTVGPMSDNYPMRKKSLFLLLPLFGLSLTSCTKTISYDQASSIKDEIIANHGLESFSYPNKNISFSSSVNDIYSNSQSDSFTNQRGSYFRLIQATNESTSERCLFRIGAEFYDARAISNKKTFMRLSASYFAGQIADLQDTWVPIMQQKAEESYTGLSSLFEDASHLHAEYQGSSDSSSSSISSIGSSGLSSSSEPYVYESDSYRTDDKKKLSLRASYYWNSTDESLTYSSTSAILNFSEGLPVSWTSYKRGNDFSSSSSYYFNFSIDSFSKPSLSDYTEVSSFD